MSSEAENDDRDAMRRLAAGEDRALAELMERWKARLTSFLLRQLGDEATALDLAEESFVRVYQGRERFSPARPFSTWLFGIAANLARQHHRWRRRHPTLPLEAAEETAAPGNPGLSAESRERELAVKEAVSSLPDTLREILILSEYERLSQAEIAIIADCSVKAVERRLSHARELLRTRLRKYLSDSG